MKSPEDLKQAASHSGQDYADYRETADITKAHSAVGREHREPTTAEIPVPIWLLVICGVCIAMASFYFGAYGGGFSGDVYSETAGSAAGSASGAKADAGAVKQEKSMFEQGKTVFSQNCQTCHQANGQGLAGQFPPLVGSEWVIGGEKRLAAILLKGIQGQIDVKGATYNGAMPAWEASLNDKKIAAVLTYIRNEWGNKASEIAPDQITAARKEFASRKEPWSGADLHQIPADAHLEGGAAPAAPAAAPAAAAPAK